jgi:hypothetical protein
VKLLSYEAAMLKQLAMPTRQEVAHALLKALIRHGGIIKEFGSNEAVVDELAAECDLNEAQRAATLRQSTESRIAESARTSGIDSYSAPQIRLRRRT